MRKTIGVVYSKNSYLLFVSVVLGLILFFISKNYGMFWDNILFASKMGNQLYYNGIFNWIMPDEFDPGHPPFLGFILAVFWKIFGHELWVAHLAMIPFIVGAIYQLIKFTQFFVKKPTHQLLAFGLILADPTLSVTLVLVNPEIIILFFFFLAINSILKNNRTLKFIALLFLSIITFRSMMLFAGIFLFEIIRNYFLKKQNVKEVFSFQFFITYMITALPGISYVIWRLATKGWFYTHPNSPWASYSETPSLLGFLKNSALIVHRYIDFGRVFIFLFLLVGLILTWKKLSLSKKENISHLILLGFSSVFFILVYCLLKTNPFGHRYFIASYISLMLAAFLILETLPKRKIIYAMLFLGLITGNLWVYPEKIAQGWNATLGHTPYHSLRIKAIDYLDHEKISIKEVASFFPNYTVIDEIDYSGDRRAFSKLNKKSNYLFYSNVYNLTDEEYAIIEKKYKEIKRFKKFPVYISIYRLKTNLNKIDK